MRKALWVPLVFAGCVNFGDFYSDSDCIRDVQNRTVTFAQDVLPVMQKSCVNCHALTANAAQLRQTYYPSSGANSAATRMGLPYADSKHMPPGGTLASCKTLIIRKWESDGFVD